MHPIPIISPTIPAKGSNPPSWSVPSPNIHELTFRHLALKVDCVNINTSNRLKQDRVFKSALCIDFDDLVASAHLLFRGRSNIMKSKALSFLLRFSGSLLNLGQRTNLCRPSNYLQNCKIVGRGYSQQFVQLLHRWQSLVGGDTTNKPTAFSKLLLTLSSILV